MTRMSIRGALLTFAATLGAGIAVLQFNLVGRVAYAVEKAVVTAVDGQLPTPEEAAELARANRLVARRSVPAVVSIETAGTEPVVEISEEQLRRWMERLGEVPEENKEELRDYLRRRFQEPERRSVRGQGSGVIIDASQGYILTNNHVVAHADQIRVKLHDARQFSASVVGTDAMTDLAVIKIEADQLIDLPIGDSDALEVGDPVMTIGNPFGFSGTVSKGVVSALDRSQLYLLDYEGLIQTDAVINPGNSGGPLVNMRAEIVGINTAIQSDNGSFNGIGLAVPAARIARVLPSLLKGEPVVRGYLGVLLSSVVDDLEAAGELGWSEPYGVHIGGTIEGSPADEAGLREHDIIVNMNGSPVQTTNQLTDQIAYTAPGAAVVFDVWRDRHMVSMRVIIGRQPQGFSTRQLPMRLQQQPELVEHGTDLSALGIETAPLTETLAEQYHLNGVVNIGVVVTAVQDQSEALKHSIRPGDVIVAVNGTNVQSVSELENQLRSIPDTAAVDLRLRNRLGSRHVMLRSPD